MVTLTEGQRDALEGGDDDSGGSSGGGGFFEPDDSAGSGGGGGGSGGSSGSSGGDDSGGFFEPDDSADSGGGGGGTATPEEDTSDLRSGAGPSESEVDRRQVETADGLTRSELQEQAAALAETEQEADALRQAAEQGIETGTTRRGADVTPGLQQRAEALEAEMLRRGRLAGQAAALAHDPQEAFELRQRAFTDPGDVRVTLDEMSLDPEVTESRREEQVDRAQSRTRRQLESETGVDLPEGSLERQEDQFVLTETGREAFAEQEQQRQERLRDQVEAMRFPEQSRGGVGPIPQDVPSRPTVGQATVAPTGGVTLPGEATSELGQFLTADEPGEVADQIFGPPGAVESAAGGVAFDIRDVSASAAGGVIDFLSPAAGFVGVNVERGFSVTQPTFGESARQTAQGVDFEDPLSTDPQTAVGQTTAGFVRGSTRGAAEATVGLPANVVDVGNVLAEGGEFTATQIEEEGAVGGAQTAAIAGGAFAARSASEFAEAAQERPAEVTGTIVGGGIAGAATTPVRIASVRVPTQGGGTTAVRGVRLREPAIARPVTGRVRGRTVVGARGLRPTLGAPSVRDVDVDLGRMGATGTATAEAAGAFEADIFRSTAADLGGEARARFREAERMQRRAARRGPASRFEFETPEEALGQARAVPESAVPDVTEALSDIDATVFGSAAARAQLPEFRQPRDIDIVVSDKAAAQRRLGEALEGESATVEDVFDIKAEADVPGRARGGEEIKGGFESMEPRDLGGVRFNPVEEELIRKAGASAFLREPGAAGTPRLDVGPEPRRRGRTDVREKDVTDTVSVARGLGFTESDVAGFQRAFGVGDPPEPTGLFGGLPDVDAAPGGLRTFAADTRGQATLGAGVARGTDAPTRPRVDAPDDARTAARADVDADSPSPAGRAPSPETPTPTPTSPSPGGRADGDGSPVTGQASGQSLSPGMGDGGDESPPTTTDIDEPVSPLPPPPTEEDIPTGSPPPSPPTTESPPPIPPTTKSPPPGPPTRDIPETRPLDPEQQKDEERRRAGVDVAGEFAKEFEFGIADPGTVLSADLDELAEPAPAPERALFERGPDVVGVTGDPTEADVQAARDLDVSLE